MQCPRCRHETGRGAKFCEGCGAALPRSCGHCGSELSGAAKFCPECGQPAASSPVPSRFTAPEEYTPKHLVEKILTSKAALEGERKQVTVLFADLKGSMELLADRDPEEARKLLDPVLEHMMEAVHRYEGTVNQVLGDGIMALFGAPVAHEDHAVRACYAALDMQRAIHRYAEEIRHTHGVGLQVRTGLNSGEVVVRAIGSDLRMDYSAIGQTTHLAARMEQLATPGCILLTADTLRLAEGWVEVRPLGPVPVKGLETPLEVYEMIRAGPRRSRLHAAAARGLTRFVGRDGELEQLRQGLARAAAGRGQVVAVVGEAGVGKSRLVWEVTHSHRTHGWVILESRSVSYGKASPYLPVIDLLKGYFSIQDRDEPRAVREKVTGKLLTLDETLKPTLPVFFSLLDIPVEDASWQALDPPQRRARTLDVLKRLLLRESLVQPLVVVFEDLHWIDAETQALLDAIVEGLPTARMLLLVNYRPEYQHGWAQKTYYTRIRLDPLPPESAADLLRALLGPDASLAPLTSLLIERTEGNPFFLEESVRTLVETRALVGLPGAFRLATPLPSIQVPATVQAVLTARIDRLLPEDKRLLQAAAVIGKDVPLVLLQAIAEVPEDALHRSLSHLQAAEFLYETRLIPDLEYTFKHALTHEVTYASLLQDRRRSLHARIVETLEGRYADRLGEHVERLAHHALRGEAWEPAVGYLRQAGLRAMARAANREAAAYFEQALDALCHLPERRENIERAIDLRFDCRSALIPLGEWERMLHHLHIAESLATGLGDQRRVGRVSNYMVVQSVLAQDYGEALRFGEQALSVAGALGDLSIEVVANAYLGLAHEARGDHRTAVNHLECNLRRVSDDLRHERFAQATVIASFSRSILSLSLSALGRFDDAIERAEEAARIAEEAGARYSLAFAWRSLGTAHAMRGDLARAQAVLTRCVDLCRTSEFPVLLPAAASSLASVLARSGRAGEALALAEEVALAVPAKTLHREQILVLLAATYLLVDQSDGAREWAQEALEASRRHGARACEAMALHLCGAIAARREPLAVAEAERHYCEALGLADQLGVRPLVAHCHGGLATLYRRTGEREQAGEHVSTATAMYREMGMTYWLEKLEAEMKALP